MVAKSKPAEKLSDDQAKVIFTDRKYPWNEWLDGSARLLSLADHFPTFKNLFTVRHYIRLAASRRGIRVRLRRNEATGTIAVQAIPHEEKADDATHQDMEAQRKRPSRIIRHSTPSVKRRE